MHSPCTGLGDWQLHHAGIHVHFMMDSTRHSRWLAAGNPPQPLEGSHLSAETYKGALDMLSKGRVTHQEMSISLGSKVATLAQGHIKQANCIVHHCTCDWSDTAGACYHHCRSLLCSHRL